MGHLINPVAFRLAWSKNWVDSFYVDNLYYPQFMHVILRLRLYLLYFFRRPDMRKFAYFYSHFNIVNAINGLTIHIFYYDGRLESDWDDFAYQSFSPRMRHQVKIYDRFVFHRFYLLVLLLLLINSLVMSRVGVRGFMGHFLNTRYKNKKSLSRKLHTRSRRSSIKRRIIHPRSYFRKSQRLYAKSYRRKRSSLEYKSNLMKRRQKKSFAKASFVLFTRLIRNYFIVYLHHHSNYGKRR